MAFDHGQGAAFEEAAALAGVAGGTDLVDFDEQCVAVAIQGHALDVLHMAGGITLAPVFLTDRDQKVTRPVVSVRRNASSFM